MPDGRAVHRWRLAAGPCSAEVLSYGGIVSSLRIPGRAGVSSVLLGRAGLEDYLADEDYVGAVVGRFANRIAGASFELGGTRYHLSRNENGNTLHGGAEGFSHRLWEAEALGEGSIRLRLHSPDGDQGFPGSLDVEVVITLLAREGGAELRFDYAGKTDRQTVFSPTFHGYFNLGAEETVAEHELAVMADYYTPADEEGIPSGRIEEVSGLTDLRGGASVGELIGGSGLDHNLVLRAEGNEPAARLTCEKAGRTLEVLTDRPGLQVYTGDKLGGGGLPAHGGIALETQAFPDSPNQPSFPSTTLSPEEVFRSRTVYRFTW
jgi:aldose 1-epimerase